MSDARSKLSDEILAVLSEQIENLLVTKPFEIYDEDGAWTRYRKASYRLKSGMEITIRIASDREEKSLD